MQKCIYHTFKYQVNSSTGVVLIKLGPTQGVDPTVHYREPLLKPGQHYTISNSGTYIYFFQLDGTIIAPTSSKPWGSGLLQWLEFTKLKGIAVQGTGTIDGRGSIWWQNSIYDDPLDGESNLIIPLNDTVQEKPPIPVIFGFPLTFSH